MHLYKQYKFQLSFCDVVGEVAKLLSSWHKSWIKLRYFLHKSTKAII